MSKEFSLLIFLLFSPALLMLLHVAFIRLNKLFKLPVSNQLSLFMTEISLNIIILPCVYYLTHSFIWVLYSFIVYNSFGYSYFHFFNMSETARRIRILVEVYEKGCITIDELKALYKGDFMIHERLNRLIALNQLKLEGENYFVRNKILLYSARFIAFVRNIYGFCSG